MVPAALETSKPQSNSGLDIADFPRATSCVAREIADWFMKVTMDPSGFADCVEIMHWKYRRRKYYACYRLRKTHKTQLATVLSKPVPTLPAIYLCMSLSKSQKSRSTDHLPFKDILSDLLEVLINPWYITCIAKLPSFEVTLNCLVECWNGAFQSIRKTIDSPACKNHSMEEFLWKHTYFASVEEESPRVQKPHQPVAWLSMNSWVPVHKGHILGVDSIWHILYSAWWIRSTEQREG